MDELTDEVASTFTAEDAGRILARLLFLGRTDIPLLIRLPPAVRHQVLQEVARLPLSRLSLAPDKPMDDRSRLQVVLQKHFGRTPTAEELSFATEEGEFGHFRCVVTVRSKNIPDGGLVAKGRFAISKRGAMQDACHVLLLRLRGLPATSGAY